MTETKKKGWNGSGGALRYPPAAGAPVATACAARSARGIRPRSGCPSRGATRPTRWVVIGLVAAVGLGVAWFVMREKPAPAAVEDGKRERRISDGNEHRPRRGAALPEYSRPDGGAAALKVPKASGQRIEQREAVPVPVPLEELEAKMKEAKPRATFTNGAEQLIAMATPVAPGARVPPLPDLSDEGVAGDVEAALRLPVVAEEGDSEEVLGKKLVVLDAKDEFAELNASEGMTFVEYLNAVRDKSNADADFLKEAHKLNDELYHDAGLSDEEYEKYREEINEKLRERGLPEVE